jgi:predicted nuclease of predicted toxin-antitoxin system
MRILLDECVPRKLRRELAGHNVRTVTELGWCGKKNGELLTLMAAQGFEVLLTSDQNLRHQQNLKAAGVAVVVLVAASNRLSYLVPLMNSVRGSLSSLVPGAVVEINI